MRAARMRVGARGDARVTRSHVVRGSWMVRAPARTPSACDIHHFATALSYPPCELRARARTHVLSTIEYTIEKRVTLERNNSRTQDGMSNMNFVRARDVEMLDVPLQMRSTSRNTHTLRRPA
jgi:hypothetical protein